ncbi:nucleotidyl transferase AbiEii/AbiGii toxin family protein [Pedobacter gandavensis]|uniref:nucleotidyl transferase AbiEii/AbiGii toxin family protein n=1 Tax=Pedobacter gandavensis TaxID=2679963 RepID=UPI00292FD848|nr:nucleotidyl transferase AbiEii/AbiGii toxin family protein [Pedobacter gandavensis]
MPPDYLHNHKEFPTLLAILESETGILAGLIEKDYWIMHVLYGLKSFGFDFELKGGTSLSKGYQIINRFSEDIDIHIKPPAAFGINENPKNSKPKNVNARRLFYDWLAVTIKIDGVVSATRDVTFDDSVYYRSGGIRLHYNSEIEQIAGVKQGILLEAGFDTVTPNKKITISSWAYERAKQNSIDIIDNRALDVFCYHPGYTFVEKLQTIATRFRQEQTDEKERPNFMRQYYDVYCLLGDTDVQSFIGTQEYEAHKVERFPKQDLIVPLLENMAFLLDDKIIRTEYRRRYETTKALYYNGQPDFDEIMNRIRDNLAKL